MINIKNFFYKYYVIIFLILIYVIYIILLNIYIKNKPIEINTSDKNFDLEIDYNIKNIDYISKIMKLKLLNKLNLLINKKQSFSEWSSTNNIIDINNHKYYFLIYEAVQNNNNNTYICRYVIDKNNIGLSWDDIIKNQLEYFITSKYSTDTNLINNMFNSGNIKEIKTIDYFWGDTLISKIVKKKTFYLSHPEFKDKDGEIINGFVIGIGIDILNLTNKNKIIYNDFIYTSYKIILHLIIIIITIIIYTFNKINNHYPFEKSILFLLLSIIYITVYLRTIEIQNSPDKEIDKVNSVNNGILSASFLISVNIYIISTITKSLSKLIIREISIVFGLALILLCLSIYKTTNYSHINNMIEIRISKQFLFNYCLLLNIYIILTYIFFIFIAKKIKSK